MTSSALQGIYDDPGKRGGHWAMAAYAGPDADVRLAGELGVRPNQLVLAWLLHRSAPGAIPLIGPRTLEQFEAALPALDLELTREHLAALDAAGA
ncbi:aldo/keto reductase [Dactylosporangium sp. CA-092794]|uniref:aldo/keto reductase n=1 Tax=Dactylosporangium sp. CA-092794 TaxID=3239929 RepID=UPI003D8EBF28